MLNLWSTQLELESVLLYITCESQMNLLFMLSFEFYTPDSKLDKSAYQITMWFYRNLYSLHPDFLPYNCWSYLQREKNHGDNRIFFSLQICLPHSTIHLLQLCNFKQFSNCSGLMHFLCIILIVRGSTSVPLIFIINDRNIIKCCELHWSKY